MSVKTSIADIMSELNNVSMLVTYPSRNSNASNSINTSQLPVQLPFSSRSYSLRNNLSIPPLFLLISSVFCNTAMKLKIFSTSLINFSGAQSVL